MIEQFIFGMGLGVLAITAYEIMLWLFRGDK